MKVLHLNTYDGNGGAGRACLRLSKALNEAGIESEVLVYYKFGANPEIKSLSNSLIQKAVAVFNILSERYCSKWVSKSVKTPFSLQWFGKSIVKNKEVQAADVLHIHWINHGFLTPRFLKQLDFLDKPIVWTFHDSNAFTGGCHVRYGCEHYHYQCGNCPILKTSEPNDQSHKTWLRKERAYSELNFKIIAPSRWMAESVKFSSLLGTRVAEVIPNTIETKAFKPYVKKEAKAIFKIPADKFIILSGFMPSKNDKHKGTAYLLEALNILAGRPEIDNDSIELVVFGNKSNAELPNFPFKTTFLGTIDNDEHLAQCYSAADVFVLPSLEDNLPNTVLESLSCGTSVVAFTTGGIPDMVRHKENGYLAAYKSSTDFAEGIAWVYNHPGRILLETAARKTVEENFSEEIIAKKHIQLYQKLLNS